LRKTIVTVEGERDAIFLREITYPLFQTASVQLYKKALLFYDDIRAGKQTDISILYGTGFPGCMELAVHLSRELWYIEDFHSIGVIADSDRGPVYQKLRAYLRNYLNTPCKKHSINPQITEHDPENLIEISFNQEHSIILWALEIQDSLEIQLARVLKNKYPTLKKCKSEDEVIDTACKKLKPLSDLIKEAIKVWKEESWFKNLCKALKERVN
jgi:hypothetical protein